MRQKHLLSALVVGLVGVIGLTAHAEPAGPFVGDTVTYLNLEESSDTHAAPLFGTPTVDGDGLRFTPEGLEISDGLLHSLIEFDVHAQAGWHVQQLVVALAGDYELAAPADSVSLFGEMLVEFYHPDLGTFATRTASWQDLEFEGSDAWSAEVALDFDEQVGIELDQVRVSITSFLSASEGATFRASDAAINATVLPEPGSLMLLAAGAATIFAHRRRRRA